MFLDNVSNNSINVYVRPGDSIQQAINNTSSGGTVIIYPGLYKDNLVVDKPLVIISKPEETTDTIIQAADPEKDIFYVLADNVTISGFNITETERVGIHCSGSYSNITGNKLSYNKYGVYLEDSNRNILEKNEVINNSLGICLKSSNDNQLKNNKVSGVGIFVGYHNEAEGISLENSDNNKLTGNAVSNLWDGVNLTESSNNELNNNSILHNYFSLTLINSNNNKVLNNTIVKRGYSYSVVLANSQNNTLQGNTGGLNTEVKIFYNFDSTNNTLEGEQYTVNEQGTGGVYRVK
ncbi:NosD domain-containing protein [Methanosarcina sp.]|jgi:parallel beta-helix repeat protein|uniref:right-handed parallel beta-helix repeat-containing protein n=1 Tax=Methanosarcina sp. TaxID=2213 RepID=UPI002BEFD1F1|nr:NosD domain-containing protein [Methanosarcina sp.]HOW13474.1 NosD domain-containing protein [Methanosarcina sp.]